MKKLSTIKVNGKNHVVNLNPRDRFSSDSGYVLPAPNYQNTGNAFCGILREGETLEEWCKRMKEWREKQNV